MENPVQLTPRFNLAVVTHVKFTLAFARAPKCRTKYSQEDFFAEPTKTRRIRHEVRRWEKKT
jgi:hypothetical protein